MAVWQRKRTGADLTGLVHHLRPWGAVQVYSLRAGPVRLRGGRLGGVEGGDSYDNALAEALSSLYKAELIRNQGPWEDIDAVEVATAEWVHWYGHHPATLRRRHAYPSLFNGLCRPLWKD